MRRREFMKLGGLGIGALYGLDIASALAGAGKLKGSKPNIVVIMPDDISWGTIPALGGGNYPNIDALYKKGLRFHDFHVSPTCSPTRASLLTGRHECYAGVTHTIDMRDRLSPKSRTIAEMLKGTGYATGIFGKWHLGDGEEYRPDKRGFGEVYIHGAGGIAQNYAHSADFPNNDYNDPVLYHNGKVVETKGYCTDLFFDQAIRWIGEQKKAKKRFFAYITPNVNHGPHIPPILPDGSRGDIMTNLDDNVGKMMKFLEKSGLSEDTLLIYLTDNGGNSGKKGFRGGKGSVYEGGTRVPCIMYWKGKIAGGIDCHKLTAHIDFYPTFAELAGSDDPVPGDKEWDGRSILPLMRDPDAEWESRYFITHRTRWGNAERAKYSRAAIRGPRYKLVFPGRARKPELYDLEKDVHEKNNIADKHPEIVGDLKKQYDAWWKDIQPFLVNDHLKNKPKTYKPYHELYRRQLGEERFKDAMKKMTWTGGKPHGKPKRKRPGKK